MYSNKCTNHGHNNGRIGITIACKRNNLLKDMLKETRVIVVSLSGSQKEVVGQNESVFDEAHLLSAIVMQTEELIVLNVHHSFLPLLIIVFFRELLGHHKANEGCTHLGIRTVNH